MNTSKKAASGQSPDLKSIMEEIEKLLKILENNETPLEESLTSFEQGVHLIRSAQAQLAQAEQKVQQLLDSEGEPELTPFHEDETES